MNTLTHHLTVLAVLWGATIGWGQASDSRAIVLDPRYEQIHTIASIANCTGPGGNYLTEVHSTREGYLYFDQAFSDSPDRFRAVLSASDCGYYFEGDRRKPLPPVNAGILRSHEFHKMSIAPALFFDRIAFGGETLVGDIACETFHGLDRSESPVKVYYDPKRRLILGFELKNPVDTSETIQVAHKQWIDTEYGKMLQEVEIVQGAKDTFHFAFDEIHLNTGFEKHDTGICEELAEKDELLKTIETFNAAFAAGNIEAVEPLICDRYLHTNGNSQAIGRSEWLAFFRNRKKEIDSGRLAILKYEMDQVQIELHGNTGIVTARILAVSERDGQLSEDEYRVTNIWVKENGTWKRAGFHDITQ